MESRRGLTKWTRAYRNTESSPSGAGSLRDFCGLASNSELLREQKLSGLAQEMDESLLQLLCAPGTHAPLRLADSEEVSSINSLIHLRLLKNRDGSTLEMALDGGLICEPDRSCYPIRAGLPVLIPGEAFDWPLNEGRMKKAGNGCF